jgi:hypothetical protein
MNGCMLPNIGVEQTPRKLCLIWKAPSGAAHTGLCGSKLMINLNQIRILWKEYQKMPFPDGYAGKDVNTICVTSLDTFAAGCIDAYTSHGNLDRNRIKILKSCLDDLDSILPELSEYPKEYFFALKHICVEIIKNTKATPK